MSPASATEHAAVVPAPLEPDLRSGTRLAGYQLADVVGRGGMGVVYRAEHVHLRRTVALKVLGPELATSDSFRERFLRESRIAATLSHPSIVTVHDAGEADGLLYIAMQFVDGTDLAALLRSEGALAPARALHLLGQVASGLDAAHALGLVHRDVKPANVLIDGERAYLTDFGLTRRISSETALTSRGDFVGTIDYMPPEQIEGGALDARSDVYALGCLLCHALTGRLPFEKDSEVSLMYAHMEEPPPPLSTLRPGLPDPLDAVVAKALSKRRNDRYASASELIAAAETAVGIAGADRPAAPTLPARPRTKILVAAADPVVQALARVSLDERRYEVFEAACGPEAVERARRERPELVVVDWGLPDTQPAGLARALRATHVGGGAKLVAVSGRVDDVDEQSALDAGFDEHLRKPFSSLQLLYKVETLVGKEAAA